MIQRPTSKLFSERPVRSDFDDDRWEKKFAKRRKLTIAAILVVVLLATYGISSFFKNDEQPAVIPTLEAQNPIKLRPDNPGGVEIPNQDKMVFGQIESKDEVKTPGVERLLPPPETPQPVVETPAMVEGKMDAAQPLAETVPEVAATPSIASEPVQAESETPKSETKPATVASVPAGKDFMVQLASFPDQGTAQAQMKNLQKKHASTLGKLTLRIQKADLGAKGVYYRVQTPAMPEAKARELCSTLKAQKAACIVVHP